MSPRDKFDDIILIGCLCMSECVCGGLCNDGYVCMGGGGFFFQEMHGARDKDAYMRRFTATVPARGARDPNRAISNSCL